MNSIVIEMVIHVQVIAWYSEYHSGMVVQYYVATCSSNVVTTNSSHIIVVLHLKLQQCITTMTII